MKNPFGNGKAKSTAKTTVAVGELIPQAHGGALRNGGTNKGGTGRPPDEFKKWCADVLNDPTTRVQAEKIMADGGHRAFRAMFDSLADRAHGKPTQDITSGGKPLEIEPQVFIIAGQRITV